MAMQNRNVVPRGRPAKPQAPRDAARTIEFDCTAIADVLDSVTPKPPPDLDAEIEVVAAVAHTLKRPSTVLAVAGSRSMLPLPAPPITEEEIEEGLALEEDFAQGSVTRARAVVHEPAFEVHLVPPRNARRSWLLPISIVLVLASAAGVVFALI